MDEVALPDHAAGACGRRGVGHRVSRWRARRCPHGAMTSARAGPFSCRRSRFARGYNPDAPAEPAGPAAALPDNVDPRQMSVFGACWALVTMKALAEERGSAPRPGSRRWAAGGSSRRGASRPSAPLSFPPRSGVPALSRPPGRLRAPRAAPLLDVFKRRRSGSAVGDRGPARRPTLPSWSRTSARAIDDRYPAAARRSSPRAVAVPQPERRKRRLAMLSAERYRAQTEPARSTAAALRLDLLPYEYARLDYALAARADG